jgi:CBS domain-containing protein
MKVEGILRSKGTNVVTVNPSATVGSIVQRLYQERIGAMVVMENGRVLGMISERDVIRGLADHGPAILDRQVADLMTRLVHSCSRDDSVKHLMSEMTRKRIRHLPVIDDGVLCGIVSIGDVVKNRLDEVEMEANVLRDAYNARA